MFVTVSFYSYFKTLAGCSTLSQELPEDATIADLVMVVAQRFPRLAAMDKSMLVAVGVDYHPRNHVLKDGDEVSLFPPVQGG
jgi:molybdopterin converting factor small subunit